MKTVLIVGSDFLPSSLPPATRIRFFSKHLNKFGWHPIVLTTRPEYYEGPVDPNVEALLPEAIEVIRTNALPSRLTRKFGVGDIGIRTLTQHWQAIKKICQQRKIDLIFIPVPPSVPMILGRMAHKRFGIPYVIDYIDPWVSDSDTNPSRKQRPPKVLLANTLARILEPFALRNVSHITAVSKGTVASVVKRYRWLHDADCTEIPYGGELSDFEYLRGQAQNNSIFQRNDGYLHLSYVGACVPAMHEMFRAVFRAVRLGLDRHPGTFGRVRLHFVGTSYAPNGKAQRHLQTLAQETGIVHLVNEHPGRIPYLESLQVMLDSYVLLLVGSNEPHYTASKVFPYILAERPLLALFHEKSTAVGILRDTTAGEVITFNSTIKPGDQVTEIYERLDKLLNSSYVIKTDLSAFQSYTTETMSRRLAEVFEFGMQRTA